MLIIAFVVYISIFGTGCFAWGSTLGNFYDFFVFLPVASNTLEFKCRSIQLQNLLFLFIVYVHTFIRFQGKNILIFSVLNLL